MAANKAVDHCAISRDFDDVKANIVHEIKTRIDNENQNYLLNVNEADYAPKRF
jgi:hypothetical protein